MIKKIGKGIGTVFIATVVGASALFYVMTTPAERAALDAKQKKILTPQEQITLNHRDRLNDYLKKPTDLEITSSWVYFEGNNVISCAEHKAFNGEAGKTVLVKRRSRTYFKVSDAAWKKHCAPRLKHDTTPYMEENVI